MRAEPSTAPDGAHGVARPINGPVHYRTLAPTHFTLREDGGRGAPSTASARSEEAQPAEPVPGAPPSPPRLAYHDDARKLWLYHGNSLELLDAIAAKYPEGRFDCIFADPPYFLSNGGISCH